MSNNPKQSWSEWSDKNSDAIEAAQAAPAEPCNEPTGPARALAVAPGSGPVWQSVNIPGGRKKWIEVRSKSWVTETEYGRHLGYRGEYIGIEQMSTEECKNWIGAMLDHFHASSPNVQSEPRGGQTL